MSAPHVHSPADGLPGHAHTHDHEHEHDHGRDHDHDHGDGHSHAHPTGVKGFFYGLFVPHSHDAADSIDDALEASTQGIRAVKISLLILLATTILQFAVVLVSGSVALLADTIHNFSDALTAIPLWIAFILGRRIATRRYTYGYGRAEDLAGLFIVGVVALSAVVAAWQSIDRFFNPQPLHNLGWVIAAGLIGFAGNELVAIYRIRVGQKIGSAALVADGVHARMDGFTSLAVVAGAVGVMLGFPLADPLVGLLISAAIIVLLWGTVRSIGRRLMDGIEPELVDRARSALAHSPGVLDVSTVRLRWVGHRLRGEARIVVADTSLSVAELVAADAERQVQRALPNLDHFTIQTVAPEPPTLGR
ncbi:cation transporter [Cryobacterium sp. TMT2-10]|uniref:Cation transporter n=1 Tax=Cryobacterium shii TaxID=1259235 RepID=A0AAQ2C514_9MICO|nr:cation diffusion facilitator family transporter [Cryobacterium sp. TMT2-23]TFC44364.1 cation transporter [Cryobacterium shii]TFC88434.1 cation transporter [Cryobacterium sp. TmT2-59]TFD18909.1 cation transporter [Cryobacterium sp. TMT2-23]TFD35784.1 cation transporter [Cryobacterium sp. TMT2-10]